ncbi:DNA replication/repair protein RecF [Thiothrix eikelboomii]|uniref:DNA replication/repair protein RecF n=1 Tax=Thiothrix eikelboomii TaxID=92487 RepID=UPI003BAF89EB
MSIWLQHLVIQHCRVIQQCELSLSPTVSFFTGANGSGKSSFLEALCVLSRGRSFRTQRIHEVISQQADSLTVTGRLVNEALASSYPLGIAKQRNGQTRIRINHADVSQQAELSSHLPLTLIHPESIDSLIGSPVHRRSLLDWLAFYLEPEFQQTWKNYQRILKQRNACLRDANQRYALAEWTQQLIQAQPKLYQFRLRATESLTTALASVELLYAAIGAIRLRLHSGFPTSLDPTNTLALKQFFQERQEQELRYGVSLFGAHRGDLLITMNDEPVIRRASRGQLKLLGIALLLAQSEAISTTDTKRGIVAIDDLAAELDVDNQYLLAQVLQKTQKQLVITSTRQPLPEFLPPDAHLFHVEQGHIRLVNT